tara:strand:- start:200 stop:1009 length:810 start_codon:yes stop_codon:yes gene_type:complete
MTRSSSADSGQIGERRNDKRKLTRHLPPFELCGNSGITFLKKLYRSEEMKYLIGSARATSVIDYDNDALINLRRKLPKARPPAGTGPLTLAQRYAATNIGFACGQIMQTGSRFSIYLHTEHHTISPQLSGYRPYRNLRQAEYYLAAAVGRQLDALPLSPEEICGETVEVNIDDDILFGPAERLFSGDVPTADQLAGAYNMFETIRMIYGGFSCFENMPYLHQRFLADALGVLAKTGVQYYQTAAHLGRPVRVSREFVDWLREVKLPPGF